MDDLRRLVDDPASSALSRSLLASADTDAPSSDGRARAARRLGIAAVLAASASAGSEAGAVVVVWKLGAVLVALGGVVGLALWRAPAPAPEPPIVQAAAHAAAPEHAGSSTLPIATPGSSMPASAVAPPAEVRAPTAPASEPPAHTPSRPAAHTSRAPARVAAAAPDVAPESAREPDAEAAAAPEAAPESAAPAPAAAPPPDTAASPAGRVAPTGPSRLAAEVALVDRARSQLGGGDYTAALAALADYHRQFPGGDLDAEADVVTMEVLIAQREPEKARTLGMAFLGRFPRSPLAQRVRSLLDRLPK